MTRIKLGILELGYREDVDALSSIKDILEYGIEAEKLGYSRFWLAEHHYYHFKNHSFTTPDILIGLLAGMTEKINVGSAGTSISLHSPYVVVTNYKLLNNLFNGRISLGLSKGVADSIETNSLINRCYNVRNSAYFFKSNLAIISTLIDNEEYNLLRKKILIPPYAGLKPELWYLSTSFNSYNEAVKYRANYCVSIFHNFNQDINNLPFSLANVLEYKRAYFKKHRSYPKIAMSIAIIIKDSIELAEKEMKEVMKWFNEETESQSFIVIPCTPKLLHERLKSYQQDYGINEFIIYDTATTNREKIKNIIEIAKVFNLLYNS